MDERFIDPLSRRYEDEAEEHIAYVAKNAVPKAVTLSKIESAVANDPMLQAVMSAVKSGSWHKTPPNISLSELSRYEKVKEQLTCTDSLLLKADRIVVPAALQERIVNIAHEGHLGMVKTKALLREKVWFPYMDKMVETKIKACLPCQVVTPIYVREPLKMSALPDNPFDEVSVDFASINGETVLLLIDDYSRFPFVEPVSSTAANAVIPKLDQLFATFGTPRVVRTDNGPPFNGDEFSKFAQILGFKHRKVTPFWPRANGEVERFVKTVKKYAKAVKTEGKNWRKELQAFLRSYRTAPHATTGVAPSVLLMKRTVRSKIPQTNSVDPVSGIIRQRDLLQKEKMKSYADRKCYVKPSNISVGDSVLVKRPFTMGKGASVYNPSPMTVIGAKGSMITAKSADATVRRNWSFFKKLSLEVSSDEDDSVVVPPVREYPKQTRNKMPSKSPKKDNIPSITLPVNEDSTSFTSLPVNEDTEPPQLEEPSENTSNDPIQIPCDEAEDKLKPQPLRRSTRIRIPRKMFNL